MIKISSLSTENLSHIRALSLSFNCDAENSEILSKNTASESIWSSPSVSRCVISLGLDDRMLLEKEMRGSLITARIQRDVRSRKCFETLPPFPSGARRTSAEATMETVTTDKIYTFISVCNSRCGYSKKSKHKNEHKRYGGHNGGERAVYFGDTVKKPFFIFAAHKLGNRCGDT